MDVQGVSALVVPYRFHHLLIAHLLTMGRRGKMKYKYIPICVYVDGWANKLEIIETEDNLIFDSEEEARKAAKERGWECY